MQNTVKNVIHVVHCIAVQVLKSWSNHVTILQPIGVAKTLEYRSMFHLINDWMYVTKQQPRLCYVMYFSLNNIFIHFIAGLWTSFQGARQGFFILGLTLTAIGTGGIKANVGPFGAQQVESQGEKAVQSFFNWYTDIVSLVLAVAIKQTVMVFTAYDIEAHFISSSLWLLWKK